MSINDPKPATPSSRNTPLVNLQQLTGLDRIDAGPVTAEFTVRVGMIRIEVLVVPGPAGSLVEAGRKDAAGMTPTGTDRGRWAVERALTVTRPGSPLATRYLRLSYDSRGRVYRWFVDSQKTERDEAEPISPFELRGLRDVTTLPPASRAVAAAAKLAVAPAVVAWAWQLWQMLMASLDAVRATIASSSAADLGSLTANLPAACVLGALTLALTWVAFARPAQQRARLVEQQLADDWRRIPVSDNRYPAIRELLIAVAPVEKLRRRGVPVPSSLQTACSTVQAAVWSVATQPTLTHAQLQDCREQAQQIREHVSSIIAATEAAAAATARDRATPAPLLPQQQEAKPAPVAVSPAGELRELIETLAAHDSAARDVAAADRAGRAAATGATDSGSWLASAHERKDEVCSGS